MIAIARPPRPSDAFIVKVQRSIDGGSMLIYNESRDRLYQGPWALGKHMTLAPLGKCFWWAVMDGTEFNLLEPADPQEW